MDKRGLKLRVQLLSDLHIEHGSHAMPCSRELETGADLVLAPGDTASARDAMDRLSEIFPATAAEAPAIASIGGNHEHYNTGESIDKGLERMQDAAARLSRAEGRDVLALENHERVIPIRGVDVRILGCTLWTDYALFGDPVRDRLRVEQGLMDYRAIMGRADNSIVSFLGGSRPLNTNEVLSRHEASVEFLRDALQRSFDGPTIVLTHHLPSMRSVHQQYRKHRTSAGFASRLDSLVDMGATLWVHGHTHSSCSWRGKAGTLVACNPAGYAYPLHSGGVRRENPKFNPRLVIDLRRGGQERSWKAGIERARVQEMLKPAEAESPG